MRYKSVYSISYDAPSDDEARSVAQAHHQELWDTLRIEGADHPLDIALEQVLSLDSEGTKTLLKTRSSIDVP